MENQSLYYFKIFKGTLTRIEIKSFHEMNMRHYGNISSDCIIFYENDRKKKTVVPKKKIDTVYKHVVYSFNSSYKNAAIIFFNHYKKQQKHIVNLYKSYEEIEKRLCNLYLK